jgi:hypothetical protein
LIAQDRAVPYDGTGTSGISQRTFSLHRGRLSEGVPYASMDIPTLSLPATANKSASPRSVALSSLLITIQSVVQHTEAVPVALWQVLLTVEPQVLDPVRISSP